MATVAPNYTFQTARIKRLALRECSTLTVLFDESEANSIRFQLEDTARGKRSGRSVAARPETMEAKNDERLVKLLHLMAEQITRQS